MTADLRCWLCGVVPEDITEIRSTSGPVCLIPRWAAMDHTCSATAPSPEDLLDQGRRALDRIRAELAPDDAFWMETETIGSDPPRWLLPGAFVILVLGVAYALGWLLVEMWS